MSVQSLSRVQLFVMPWIAARKASLSITNSWSSLKLTSIESVMPSSHLMLCRPLFLLPPIPPCREQELHPWQRSWGRRLGICKGGIEPQESPWKFSSIYPQNQSLPTFCFVLSPTPLTLWGGCPPLPLSEKRVNLQLQLIIPGCDSVSIYKLLWKSSSLPE